MSIKNIFDTLNTEGPLNENGEQVYELELTRDEIIILKCALDYVGLYHDAYRKLYKKLCEVVSGEEDKMILAKYE